MEYGLIGKQLIHSYAEEVHEALCDYHYELYPLPTEEEAHAFMKAKNFKAINVTLPYKELVIPYCDIVDPKAAAIGAVNTIVNRDGQLHGYNTDYDGFLYMARQHGVDFKGKSVLVLGTGATSRTVQAVAQDEGAGEILFASRSKKDGAFTYEEVHDQKQVQIIINTTPAGMYPHVGECHVHPEQFPNLEAVLDVVYNPFKTELILRAQAAGAVVCGGLEMLVAQALYAAQHFTRQRIPESHIMPICHQIFALRANVSLVGMPGSGKSTIGRQLAVMLGHKFVDLDEEVEKRAGCTIAQLFETKGETAFRDLEQQVCQEFGEENTQIISCGGGVVLRAENRRALRQNGLVVFIDRPVELLPTGRERPLSTGLERLRQMEQERRSLYESIADIRILNDTNNPEKAVQKVKEAIYETFGYQ